MPGLSAVRPAELRRTFRPPAVPPRRPFDSVFGHIYDPPMRPRAKRIPIPFLLLVAACLALVACAGCDGDRAGPTTTSSDPPAKPTVASLVPAATDLILAMGAGDQLVAVSNYDYTRDGTAGKARVGDYLNTDWEQIRALRPAVMIRQYHPDRVPAGLREKAESMGIRLVVLQIDGLEDVFRAYDALGEALGRREDAAAAKARLRAKLESVRQRTQGLPTVPVLVSRDESGLAVVGPGTFLDELLPYAGGVNAAAALNNRYPTIDREMLRSLDPQVIVQLLPNAEPQKLEQARRMWGDHPGLRAVRDGRVYQLTEWYALLPAAHLGDLAEKLAAALHPEAFAPTTTPTTRPVTLPASPTAGAP
jgi:iron complex transport system substrate-binding protein